ncbi:hypothetical protein M426DRAFT_325568, partial [Hypoxylon sp. CI-4A]
MGRLLSWIPLTIDISLVALVSPCLGYWSLSEYNEIIIMCRRRKYHFRELQNGTHGWVSRMEDVYLYPYSEYIIYT